MKIIGIGYKARNGKDTVAKAIHGELPYTSVIVSFADELKALARSLGMTTKNGEFLQKLGEAMRVLDPDYWIKKVELKLAELKPEIAIIPDMRYQNEFKWVVDCGGLVVKVVRLTEAGEPWITNDRPHNHISEIDLDAVPDEAWDYICRAMNGDMKRLRLLGEELARRVSRAQP